MYKITNNHTIIRFYILKKVHNYNYNYFCLLNLFSTTKLGLKKTIFDILFLVIYI